MFGTIFSAFTEHLAGAATLFIVLFLTFGFIFCGGEAGPFIGGMIRVVVSGVYSPFVFLRRSAGIVVNFAKRGEADYSVSEQYLLNKLLLWWQAVVIVFAIGWLSVGVVRTWYALLAPAEVRTELASTRQRLADEQQQLAAATADVTRLDSEWNQQKDKALAAYRLEREKTIREADQRNTAIAAAIQQSGNAQAINDLGVAQRYAQTGSSNRIQGIRDDLDRWIYQQYYLDEGSKSQLRAWSANWQLTAQARLELNTVSVDSLRAAAQPNYNSTVNKKAELEARVPETERTVQQLEENARLRWSGALLTLTVSIVQFLFAVWLLGVLTEGLALMIRLADNVHAIRGALSAQPDQPPATLRGAERLPIVRLSGEEAAV